VAHDPVLLSAHSGLNFWMGNSPGATGYPKIPAGLRASQEGLLKDSITWAEKAAGHPLKRSEVSKYWAAKAHDYIESFPEAWHRLLLLKVRNFWNGFVYDDISVITILQERGVLLPGFSWGMIAPWAIAGAALALYRRSAAGWVLAAVLLHMLALMPVFITERYRMPAAPGLIILAVYGIWAIAVSKGYARLAALLVYVAIAITAADLFAMPTGGPELQALTPYNVGVKELEFAEERMGPEHSPEDRAVAAAELASAERHLNRAYALVQGDPGIVFALGNLALDKNDRAKAKACYEQTLTLNPHFSGAWKNLGYLAVEEKQWPEAERYLKEAVKEDPTNAMTHYLLAQAQEALGKAEPARASAEEAHRLLPSDRRIQELRERLQSGPKQ
jgi:tetratricopeptide (TPR) repeat protein